MERLTNDEAATKIQNAWKQYRGKEMVEIEKMLDCLTTREADEPKLDSILSSTDVLIAKLDSLRRSRAYEIMKYEQIVNMPSGNVGSYLETESKRPEEEKSYLSKVERILFEEKEKIQDEAARKIQKLMRENAKRKQEARVKQHWTEFEGPKRVELLGKVAERLGGKYILRRTDVETVRFKIASKDLNLDGNVTEFARRERLIKSLRTNINSVKRVEDIKSLLKNGDNLAKTPVGGFKGVAKGQQLFQKKIEKLELENLQNEFKDLR
ncbi:hypothetical protein L596_017830 [Steinernema carpocapsae]|uniref:Uncharacterized protein n=1 Tax=Steinernema carpocapsae TaxID=34508 RepID=A0A4U5N2T4_STECR|nr:hypothetical protein L596_017830 [Steinernema carpocapsae]